MRESRLFHKHHTAEASGSTRQRGGGLSEEEMIITHCHPRRRVTPPLELLPKSTSLFETWVRCLRLVGVTRNMRKGCEWSTREQSKGRPRETAGPEAHPKAEAVQGREIGREV